MTTLARLALLVLLSLFASSCNLDINFGNSGKVGNGTLATDTRSVQEDFTIVYASEGIDVFVSQGNNFKIEIEGDENIIDLIGTDIKNGKLTIHAIENIGRATKKVYVTLPSIKGLKSSSGAHLTAEGRINANSVELDASSGGNLVVELQAEEVFASASSGADIEIIGNTTRLDADASSGANIEARELIAETCNAEASSGSDIAVYATKSLIANASSGADISYSGDPTVEKRKSSSGSVYQN